jgi:hypothetical protein
MSVESSSHVAAPKDVADAGSPDSKPGPARKGVSPGNPLNHPSPLKPVAPIDRENPYTGKSAKSEDRPVAAGSRPIDKNNPYKPAQIDSNNPYNSAKSANESGNPPVTTQPRPIDQHHPYPRR